MSWTSIDDAVSSGSFLVDKSMQLVSSLKTVSATLIGFWLSADSE